MSQPRIVSNDVNDFAGGGLYPGGTGIITDIFYTNQWTYEGKVAPGSNMTVMLKFQPTDGSGEGKPMDIPWSCGTSGNDFQPSQDGGNVLAFGERTAMSESSNWAAVQKALQDQCGLDTKKLNSPIGIKVLVGTHLMLVRKEQAKREGLNDAPAAPPAPGQPPAAKRQAPTFLCPIKATFPWEQGAVALRGQAAPTPAAVNPAPTQVPGIVAPTVAIPPTTAAPVPGVLPTTSSETALGAVVKEALNANGGSIPFADAAQKVSEMFVKFPGVLRAARAAYLLTCKDVDKLEVEVAPFGIQISQDGQTISLA